MLNLFFKPAIFAFTALVSSYALAQTPVPDVPKGPEGKAAAAKDAVKSTDAVKVARVFFVTPKDGQTVTGPDVKVVFGLEGMKLAKAGTMTAGTGHHHLIIDGPFINAGSPVPNDPTHLHFGAGQTETMVKLPKGKHTLTLQFADGSHISYGPLMTQTISITVK